MEMTQANTGNDMVTWVNTRSTKTVSQTDMGNAIMVAQISTGNIIEQQDYNTYKLSVSEITTGFVIGLVAGTIAVYIMFSELITSIIIGIIVGFFAVPLYKKYLLNKRKKTILLQFRDMLDSLSNSFSAGRNTTGAFADAYSDLKMTYGEKAPIVNELRIILKGLYNNFTIEDLLKSMAERCGIEDIRSFAETFIVCNRMGGNLKKIVLESKDIINDKIEIEMDIQATIASNKNEINILCIMPFVIISMMKLMGIDTATDNSPINVLVKIVAVVLFVTAYILGKKIADIKV